MFLKHKKESPIRKNYGLFRHSRKNSYCGGSTSIIKVEPPQKTRKIISACDDPGNLKS